MCFLQKLARIKCGDVLVVRTEDPFVVKQKVKVIRIKKNYAGEKWVEYKSEHTGHVLRSSLRSFRRYYIKP